MVRKIRYKRLVLFLLIVFVLVLILLKFLTLRITNIYVDGNVYFSDQEIIEMAKLSNYPSSFFTFSNRVKSNISKNQLIESAKVSKKSFTKIYINVVENRPLFYDQVNNKTVLKDGSTVDKKYNIPSLSNTVSNDVYNEFLSQFSMINYDVFNNISEIEYTPNSVDSKLFLFTMNDGNYIYVNLDRFESVNKYFDMIVNFNNHKGILYLDSGEYFKILEN
jgi:cell division protein FtsQ